MEQKDNNIWEKFMLWWLWISALFLFFVGIMLIGIGIWQATISESQRQIETLEFVLCIVIGTFVFSISIPMLISIILEVFGITEGFLKKEK